MVRGVLVAVCLLVVGAEAGAQALTPAVVRVPGETPGAVSRNHPFFSTDIVLSNFGYVEEEFFFDGTANTYTMPELGRNAEVATRGTPYRSRLLVRRPATPARFNGVVIVEWLNVTNGYDTDVLWLYQKEFFLREGYAWVGVSAQGVGVSRPPNGLKVWSPSRYGSLNVDGGGAVTGDALGYDIYTQAGAAVKHVPSVLGGLRPQIVMAAGQSQSAGRLGPYLNAIHPLTPVYDAAMLTVNNTAIRADLTLPVIKVLSETEWAGSRSQPDTDRVRIWTVAGSTHSEQYSLLSRAAFLKRDLGLEAVDACETPSRSRVEIRSVYNAAVDALVKWVRAGSAAPRAPALEFDESAAPVPIGRGGGGGRGGAGRGGDATAEGGRGGGRAGAATPPGGRGPAATTQPLKRDQFGNALGGIRLAEIAVPVAKESAELCGLGGTHVPFDAATVNRLYPTHDDYVRKVTSASDAAVRAGFLLPADATQTIARARRSIWGRQLTCGPLCADVAQFPKHPSSMLLANQTEFLVIKDAERTILRTADEVTRLVAEGYTAANASAASRKFLDAAMHLDRYVAEVRVLAGRGLMPPETRDLLVSQAAVLQGRLRAEGK
ncbi:MAG: hypothetical protein IT183_01365 [Acidobacteria bacterium]|nr:hypothetical protein [Acidobacteriota bacterium]